MHSFPWACTLSALAAAVAAQPEPRDDGVCNVVLSESYGAPVWFPTASIPNDPQAWVQWPESTILSTPGSSLKTSAKRPSVSTDDPSWAQWTSTDSKHSSSSSATSGDIVPPSRAWSEWDSHASKTSTSSGTIDGQTWLAWHSGTASHETVTLNGAWSDWDPSTTKTSVSLTMIDGQTWSAWDASTKTTSKTSASSTKMDGQTWSAWDPSSTTTRSSEPPIGWEQWQKEGKSTTVSTRNVAPPVPSSSISSSSSKLSSSFVPPYANTTSTTNVRTTGSTTTSLTASTTEPTTSSSSLSSTSASSSTGSSSSSTGSSSSSTTFASSLSSTSAYSSTASSSSTTPLITTTTTATTTSSSTSSTTTTATGTCKTAGLTPCDPTTGCYRNDYPPGSKSNGGGCTGCLKRSSSCDDSQTYCFVGYYERFTCTFDSDCDTQFPGRGAYCAILYGSPTCVTNPPADSGDLYCIANAFPTTTTSTSPATSASTTTTTTTTTTSSTTTSQTPAPSYIPCTTAQNGCSIAPTCGPSDGSAGTCYCFNSDNGPVCSTPSNVGVCTDSSDCSDGYYCARNTCAGDVCVKIGACANPVAPTRLFARGRKRSVWFDTLGQYVDVVPEEA